MSHLFRRFFLANCVKQAVRIHAKRPLFNFVQFPVCAPQVQALRFKSKKSKPPPKQESESESQESTEEDEVLDKHTKIMNINVNSLRADAILKSGLGIARNKIETLFFESKIRINGKKMLKKSEQAQAGDELDIVKGPSGTNPEFLTVARVEILDVKEKGDSWVLKIRRNKSLTIEKYADE